MEKQNKTEAKKYKYNFINKYGEIIKTNNLSTIQKGLSWNSLNLRCKTTYLLKSERDFFEQYGLSLSVFNVATFQQLGMVYLFKKDLERLEKLKGGIKT